MKTPIVPVSVIVPNFNSGKYLEYCITSINSSQCPAEIIIIDDCSTDNSLELAFELELKYSNIKVLKRVSNGGAAEARKLGILTASQDWIALVDADDFLEEKAIQNAYSTAVRDGSDVCIWDMWRTDSERSWRSMSLNPNDFPKSGRQATIETLGQWKIHPLGVSRKEIYINAYREFSETILNADELLTRLVFASASKISFSEKRYFYRVNPDSSTQTISTRRLTTLHSYIWLLKFARNYPEVNPEIISMGAIAQAWHFFKNRKAYGTVKVMGILTDFIPKIAKEGNLHKWIWKRPKHLIAFSIIFMFCRFRIIKK